MRKVTTLIRHLSMAAGLLLTNAAIAQTTAFSESMGSVGGTTTIAAHEAANGFDNDAQTMTGTADVRNTLPSSGYAGASGLANIFFTNIPGRFFQIEEINTTGFTGIEISFGIHKSTIASNGSDFLVEVSSDGIVYTPLTFPALPAGSGTAVWHYRTATGTIPATANLRVRFTNNSSTTQYRVDDVLLSVPCPNATVTADGPATLCNGGSVTLTANSGDAYLWSNGATTQSITVSSSATFTVTVTNGACVSTSEPVRVLVYPEPIIGVNSSDDAVCPGESVTLNARLVLPDLIFSEYVEGTSNEKYIEIFNGTGAAVNLANYEYHAFHNGISTPGFIVPLSGALADGDVLVLKNGSAVLYPGGTAAFGVQHNGDDALAIYNVVTASYTDIFGSIGHDPGTEWTAGSPSTLNQTLRRNMDVFSGITVNPNMPGPSGFGTLGSEWAPFPVDDVSGLGSHSTTCNFTWSPATTPATGCTVTATPPTGTNTTYTASGTFNNGCTGSGSVTVNQHEQPTVDAESDQTITLCYGPSCATLTADAVHGEGPFTFNWSNGATGSTITVCPTTTTVYCVTITDANGCTNAPDCAAVTVIDACCGKKNDKVLVCHNGHTICVSSGAVPAHLAHGDQLGECAEGKSHTIVEETAISQSTIAAYPNPFNNTTTIHFDLNNNGNVKVEVLDVHGKVVSLLMNGNLNAGSYNVNWDASVVTPGVYVCKISNGGEISTLRLVVQK